MAAPVLNTNYQDNNNLRSWPMDATEALIRRRRYYHNRFIETRVQNQGTLWQYISNHIFNNHNFNVTATQCRTKWNALVAGYENLKRLLSDNPEGYRHHFMIGNSIMSCLTNFGITWVIIQLINFFI